VYGVQGTCVDKCWSKGVYVSARALETEQYHTWLSTSTSIIGRVARIAAADLAKLPRLKASQEINSCCPPPRAAISLTTSAPREGERPNATTENPAGSERV